MDTKVYVTSFPYFSHVFNCINSIIPKVCEVFDKERADPALLKSYKGLTPLKYVSLFAFQIICLPLFKDVEP